MPRAASTITPIRRFSVALLALLVLGAGAGSAQAVVGGKPVAPGAYPFVAALVDDRMPVSNTATATDWDRQKCGGSVIAPTIVLTAAHCVMDLTTKEIAPPQVLHVVIGRTDLTAQGGERLDVARVVVDPSFRPGRLAPDLALLQLASPTTAPPIALGDARAGLAEGMTATAIGWGRTGSGAFPHKLLQATLPLWSSARCGRYWGALHQAGYMLCASSPFGGADACTGDSGGPLIVRDGAGTLRLFGVVSFGAAACGLGAPGVFAWVASPFLRTWVLRRSAAMASGDPDATPPAIGGVTVGGDAVRYTLSEPAEVVVQVVRTRGRVRTPLDTALVQERPAGPTGFRIPHALRGRRLTAGRYVLRLVATDAAGNRSPTVTAPVVIG
jgi:secreted trypsin-like serine protease